MLLIAGNVGVGGANRRPDVSLVQSLLLRHARWLDGALVTVTGRIDGVTNQAIHAFQRNAAALLRPDGVVSRHGFTLHWLNRTLITAPRNRVFSPLCWARSMVGLTAADYGRERSMPTCRSA